MKENEFPVLEVSDIDWDKDHDEYDELPRKFKLNWGLKDWYLDEVSQWISQKFDWLFNNINISQIGTWEDNGYCCAGGCSCC
tara:strand:- start:941 stop:1186 length:246 start_codon:yes stop_codon:yes gene_type:complete